MTFPERSSHQIAQDTNPLEPLNKEVKRRADVIGIFQNEASITPINGAVLLGQNVNGYCSTDSATARRKSPSPLFRNSSSSVILSSVIGSSVLVGWPSQIHRSRTFPVTTFRSRARRALSNRALHPARANRPPIAFPGQ